MVRSLVCTVLLLVLSGCSTPPSDPTPPAPALTSNPFSEDVLDGTSSTGWDIIVPGPVCGTFCEPVVAVNLDGRIFVKGTTYARSTVNGTFEAFNPPPVPLPTGAGGFQTDRHLQVAPDGALWFHSLIGSNAGAFLLVGVQVARSLDDGDSWVSAYLPFESTIPTQSLGADRQWMAFAPDGTAFVTFQQNAVVNAFVGGFSVAQPNTANIWAARSDDDGVTWTQFSPMDGLNPTADQATGQPIIDGKGRLLIPFHRSASTVPGALPRGFAVAVSADGATATQEQVTLGGTMFPVLVQLASGVFLAAHNDGARLALGTSTEVAGPWELTPFSQGDMLSSPWLGVRANGTWDLVWMEAAEGENHFDVRHAMNGGTPTTIAGGLLGGPGIRSSTDFMHAAYLGERLLVVTSDAETGRALLFLEP